MEKLREIWNNGKSRGIILLAFYFLLFSYIFLVYGGRNNEVILPEKIPPKQTEEEKITSYEYEYVSNDEVVNIIKYNDIVNFKLNDVDYYYIDNKTYKLENEKFYEIENPLKYNFDYIGNIQEIKKLSTVVKTSTYADGSIEENYDVNFSQLLSLFGITEEVDASEMLNYSIFYTDGKIMSLVFEKLNLKINYINFDNISEINVNYEFYEEGVEE